MSDFKDLDDTLGIGSKQLPISGELIDFPARISGDAGMLLILMRKTATDHPGATPEELSRLAGVDDTRYQAVVEEMLGRSMADALILMGNAPRLQVVIATLTSWHLYGEDVAREVWNNPGEWQALLAGGRSAGPAKSKGQSPAKAKSARPGSPGSPKPHKQAQG